MNSVRPLVLVLVFGAVGISIAQNLVPNGGFEEYTQCPTTLGQVERAIGWSDVFASPDYFNRCNTNDSMDVPLNLIGYQEPFDGNGYVGMVTYLEDAPGYRECIQHELTSPLTPGVPVFLSMLVSPGGFGNDPNNNSVRYASSGIGIKFTNEAHSTFTIGEGNMALTMESVLNDTASWHELSGVYVPDSAYRFIAIGCYLDQGALSIEELDAAGEWNGAYAFVDRVCVATNSSDCLVVDAIQERTPLMVLLGDGLVGEELHLRFKDLSNRGSLQLLDVLGRHYRTERIVPGSTEIRWAMENLPDGTYLIKLFNGATSHHMLRILHVSP